MTVPDRILRLPRDPRGIPIPWNALRTEEAVFFTVNDDRRGWRALREGLCPICGERLGRWLWFVGGPQVRVCSRRLLPGSSRPPGMHRVRAADVPISGRAEIHGPDRRGAPREAAD